MVTPTVSVILTAHNYGRFLDQSIGSVLGQTFQDFELVILNDGSTDNSAEVLGHYAHDPRITVYTLPSVGLAAACNDGIRRSLGMYVLRLDADDFLDPHALMIETSVLEQQPEIGLVYPDFYTVDGDGRFIEYVRVPRVQDGARLLDSNPLAGGALYRRSCYDAIGGYDETLRYQEDFDFWLRFTERFRAHAVGLPLLSYRQHSGSMSKNRVERAAARRYVKNKYATSRRLLDGEKVLVVMPSTWPEAPGRSERLLCRSLNGWLLLEHCVEQATAWREGAEVILVTDDTELRRTAESLGVEVVAPPRPLMDGPGRPVLTWLRNFLEVWSRSGRTEPTVAVLVSPYCPFRHPDRIREAVDTLLIHACDLVLSTDADPILAWAATPKGLRQLYADATLAGSRVLREAGELLAVRTSGLKEHRPLTEFLVGYVELFFPEWWCVKDESTSQLCQELLLSEATTIRVPRSAFLRSP